MICQALWIPAYMKNDMGIVHSCKYRILKLI